MAVYRYMLNSLALVMLLIVMTLNSSKKVSAQAQAQAQAQVCNTNIQGIISQCRRFVSKSGPEVQPSNECCGFVINVDVPCICSLLPGVIERDISMDKVVYVARSCGKQVPPGTKCGDYTAPPM